MTDNYSHVQSGIYYIVENIIGPVEQTVEYKQLLSDFNSQLTHHCACEDTCSEGTCACFHILDGNNYLGNYKDGHMKHSVIECNDNCNCSELCGNRVVQRGPIGGLKIRICDIEAKGFGLYSSVLIPQGTFICEYAGELITKSEACERHNRNKLSGKMNYIFCLNEHSGGKVLQTFVDPSNFGNIGRYINHSCDPNCYIVPVRCQTPIPKLAIFSNIDILAGEEVTFNYGSEGNNTRDNVSNRVKCLCNSQKCYGLMPCDIY